MASLFGARYPLSDRALLRGCASPRGRTCLRRLRRLCRDGVPPSPRHGLCQRNRLYRARVERGCSPIPGTAAGRGSRSRSRDTIRGRGCSRREGRPAFSWRQPAAFRSRQADPTWKDEPSRWEGCLPGRREEGRVGKRPPPTGQAPVPARLPAPWCQTFRASSPSRLPSLTPDRLVEVDGAANDHSPDALDDTSVADDGAPQIIRPLRDSLEVRAGMCKLYFWADV